MLVRVISIGVLAAGLAPGALGAVDEASPFFPLCIYLFLVGGTILFGYSSAYLRLEAGGESGVLGWGRGELFMPHLPSRLARERPLEAGEYAKRASLAVMSFLLLGGLLVLCGFFVNVSPALAFALTVGAAMVSVAYIWSLLRAKFFPMRSIMLPTLR